MAEEPTTPDLVEFVSRTISVASVRNVARFVSFFAPNAVFDMAPMGADTFEGVAAIRAFVEDWWGPYDEYAMEEEEILDLGNGVAFAVIVQNGRPVGSTGFVQLRYASVNLRVEGLYLRITNYSDIGEARTAAECLAGSRG